MNTKYGENSCLTKQALNKLSQFKVNNEPLKDLEDKLNTKWVNGLSNNKELAILEITTNSLEELTNTMNIIHEHLCAFTRKHPEVGYSMKANRINQEDNSKHILKVTVGG